VSSFDAETGALAWRWSTVPGDPSKPFENEAMAKAAETWDDKFKYWENGGGGTVWHTFSADPSLNLLYFGTGNAGPLGLFDPQSVGEGQSLYLVGSRPRPRHRQVHLAFPGQEFRRCERGSGYGADGRPIEITGARGTDKPFEAVPGPFGAHNWQSMSFSPKTGLAYIPAQNVPLNMGDDPNWSQGSAAVGQSMNAIGWNLGKQLAAATGKPFGRLVAWDPVAQKAARTQDYASPWNGGTLATAGGWSSRERRMDGSPTTRRAASSCGTLLSAAALSQRR
jgi:quinohemoprotein ethanol dehydrogenase